MTLARPDADGRPSLRPSRGPLTHPTFRKLYAVRLFGQFGDGVFQASLAGAVLFNPERAAHAADIAAGFAVVLLPYSLIGPFAGVLIDRWSRQRILLVANLVRALCVLGVAAEVAVGLGGVAFYASALVVVSVNRFVLSALSASLPHAVDEPTLVGANALSTTSGAIAATAGGAAAIGVRSLFDAGGGDHGYAIIAVSSVVPYVLAGLAALRFARAALGPDLVTRAARERVADVVLGLRAGARHVYDRRPVLRALAMIAVHRFCYGVSTICTLLLYRNHFHDEGFLRAGLAGLAQVVTMVAIGGGLAAVLTPAITRRVGLVRYPAALLLLAAITQIGLGLPFRMAPLLAAALVLGFAAQAIKISVDTTVQRGVEDAYRGRVFSLYDTLFNVCFVAAAVVTATLLPDDGRSVVAVVVLGLGYLLAGAGYLRVCRPLTAPPSSRESRPGATGPSPRSVPPTA